MIPSNNVDIDILLVGGRNGNHGFGFLSRVVDFEHSAAFSRGQYRGFRGTPLQIFDALALVGLVVFGDGPFRAWCSSGWWSMSGCFNVPDVYGTLNIPCDQPAGGDLAPIQCVPFTPVPLVIKERPLALPQTRRGTSTTHTSTSTLPSIPFEQGELRLQIKEMDHPGIAPRGHDGFLRHDPQTIDTPARVTQTQMLQRRWIIRLLITF
mmetsp:Transcript_4266/g.4399  ORF Transcript_4266/g.4399 Transcript_4266/m.4399 type:complete len:208 (+) Transcript_4266:758-1381(+)